MDNKGAFNVMFNRFLGYGECAYKLLVQTFNYHLYNYI